MKPLPSCLPLVSLTVALSGCAVGYDYALFSTKSNFGLDIDTKPPTMEMGISRRETALVPAYAGGDTPPLYGDFAANQSGAINKFFLGLSSAFAGGDAAIALTSVEERSNTEETAPTPPAVASPNFEKKNGWSGCVALPEKEKPYYETLGIKKWSPAPPNEIRPFSFATDTTFGLKATWITPAGAIPDAVKVGFNRKEFALTPITLRQADCQPANGNPVPDGFRTYRVEMPAFFALIQNRNDLRTLSTTSSRYMQVFATGKAATNVAAQFKQHVQARLKEVVEVEKRDEEKQKAEEARAAASSTGQF